MLPIFSPSRVKSQQDWAQTRGPLNTGKQAAQNPISSWNFLPEASPREVSFQDIAPSQTKADFVSKLSSGEINSPNKKKKKDVKARAKI